MKINKIFILAGILISSMLSLNSCSSDDDYTPGPEVAADCADLSFGSDNVQNMEVDPDITSIDIQVYRANTQATGTYAIKVLTNQDSVFTVPESVSFAAGQEEAVITVSFSKSEQGTTYTLELGFDDADVNPYTATNKTFAYTVTRVKWEKLGTGYWVDGTVPTFFDVDSSFPYAVEIEKLTTKTGARFRFNGPFSHVATDFDGIGYIGYVYNEEGDCDEEDHLFVIDVTSAGATLKPLEIGMDWGYGTFSIGTVVGNLSSGGAVITDTNTYPLGVYNEKAGVITFPVSSLYVRMADYGIAITTNPSYLYLSAEAYLAAVGEEE